MGVAIERSEDKAQRMADDLAISFPVLLDDQNVASRLYDPSRLPHTVVIDREGNIAHVEKGFKNEAGKRIAAVVTELVNSQ